MYCKLYACILYNMFLELYDYFICVYMMQNITMYILL